MTAVTLDQAERIIDAIIARGAALNCRPLSVIVVEPGCKVKAFKKEDGASMIRFEMAYGKAYAALSLGRSSKLIRERTQERPIFMRYLIAASGDQIFPEGGGMLIRDPGGEVIGAVGVTGYRGPRRRACRPRHPRRGAEDRCRLHRHGTTGRFAANNLIFGRQTGAYEMDRERNALCKSDCLTMSSMASGRWRNCLMNG
jgi:uncharacterized protein GlcG (DUF336 family)